jgi:hypothetical protein
MQLPKEKGLKIIYKTLHIKLKIEKEMCEDTKGVIRSRKSKNRQHNDQK